MSLRILQPGDEPVLTAFLEKHADSSVLLRSNLAHAGLEDRGERFEGTWAATFEASGELRGVVAHFWNGVLVHQTPVEHVVALGRLAVRTSGRGIKGLLGPWAQVDAARTGHGLQDAQTGLCSKEELMGLNLADLEVPKALANGAVVCRTGAVEDLPALAHLRREFRLKAIREKDHPALAAECEAEVRKGVAEGSCFLLLEGDRPVSTCMFSGRTPDCVQIGGVWTPEELRGKGYARAVVAGALLHARAQGVRRSVLFTGEQNTPALIPYRAIGYSRVGDYGIIYFKDPQSPR